MFFCIYGAGICVGMTRGAWPAGRLPDAARECRRSSGGSKKLGITGLFKIRFMATAYTKMDTTGAMMSEMGSA